MKESLIIKNHLVKEEPLVTKTIERIRGAKSAKLHERLIESEIRYRRLFESAKDGILILDFKTGKIVDANPFIIELIGSTFKQLLGKKLWEIGLFVNKDESERAFSELKTRGYIRFEDMPIPGRNGKISQVEFISNVYYTNKKKVIQCNIRDISERKLSEMALLESRQYLKKQNLDYRNLNEKHITLNKELSESLNQIQIINSELMIAKVKAEESDRLKSAFLANMSHEIRTPMNAIMGFSKLLTHPRLSNVNLQKYVQIINSSSLQLLSVINDIIDISKIDTGQFTIESNVVNINDICKELFVSYKKIVNRKMLKLNFSGKNSKARILIKTDGNRIKQILCNLLNNAIKYTEEGTIEFGYNILENHVAFYVKDSGIGIDVKYHKMIFQRFRQVLKNDNQLNSGNGLGLSISQSLVEKLGGTISVDSALGGGSTFTFTIPYGKESEFPVSPALKDKYSRIKDWSDKLILIVEDDASNHSYIEAILSTTSVKVVHAWDGNEAVEQVKKHTDISLVLMDIRMPVMNGYDAVRLIKQIRPQLPVIAQTAFAFSQDREHALDAGCDNYISKPIPSDKLVELIKKYLN